VQGSVINNNIFAVKKKGGLNDNHQFSSNVSNVLGNGNIIQFWQEN
jgi:hypothetical protein